MRISKYTGVTLLYFSPEGQAVQKSIITTVRTLDELERKLSQIRKKTEKDIKAKGSTYIGIKDVFEINGPLKQGAILGRSILWSYKTLEAAKKLLKPESDFWINMGTKRPVKQYIAEIVFLLSSPIKFDDRRTIVCNVLIDSSKAMDEAIKVGGAPELRERLYRVLLQYEPDLTNELKFVGIANIRFAYDKVAVGKCFEALCKKEKSLISAKKLIAPASRFTSFFKEMNSVLPLS